MASIFLRLDIVYVILRRGGGKTSPVGSAVLIHITLQRAVTQILRCIHALWQEQADAESRKVRHGHLLLTMHRHLHAPLAIDDAPHTDLQNLLQNKGRQG